MAVEWVTWEAILQQAGASPGNPPDDQWADECAAAVNEALDIRLAGAAYVGEPAEIRRAALVAGVFAYKAREANVDATAPAIVGDYLEPLEPIIARWATVGIA